MTAIYRQEIIHDVTLFTSLSAAKFYDKLFDSLDFTLPRAATGRRGFPVDILTAADRVIPLKECTFLADKGYDAKGIYNIVRATYDGEAFIPLNMRGAKTEKALPAGNPACEVGLAMHKDGKTTDNGRTRQKYGCPFRQSKTGACPCSHKNWNNGKKNRGCTKYKIIPTDYRLSIDRKCLRFKRIYVLRTECERYNSRFKASGQERLWVRNGSSAANQRK